MGKPEKYNKINRLNASGGEMNKNTCKSADELAWDFVLAEMERQFHEPQAILARLAGAEGYDPRNSRC